MELNFDQCLDLWVETFFFEGRIRWQWCFSLKLDVEKIDFRVEWGKCVCVCVCP